MKVQYKETIWNEIEIPKGLEKDVLESFQSGKISDPHELFDIFDSDIENQLLFETTDFIEPDFEQDGYSTIEIVDDNYDTLWDNSSTQLKNYIKLYVLYHPLTEEYFNFNKLWFDPKGTKLTGVHFASKHQAQWRKTYLKRVENYDTVLAEIEIDTANLNYLYNDSKET